MSVWALRSVVVACGVMALVSGERIVRAESCGDLDPLTGRAVIDGCKGCINQSKEIKECYYAIEKDPCSPDACQIRTAQFFTCAEAAKSEKSDCDVVEKEVLPHEVKIIRRKQGLNCGDVNQMLKVLDNADFPKKGKCVTYPEGEFQARCQIAACDGMILNTSQENKLTACKK